jgi:translation elongation factor EF-4
MFDVAVQASIGAQIIARDDQGHAKERAGEVLRRRHHAQEEAPGKAEGRQEADESRRQRRNPPGGIPGHPKAKKDKWI